MDIVLGSRACDGIEAVKRFAPDGCGTQVVYVTGHPEYCTKVYQTEHVYFLTKPVAQAHLDDALGKALANLERAASRPIAVQTGGTVHALVPERIDFIESDRRKVRIHQGQEVIEAYASLAELAEKLPASFVRCHKGFLVNMDHIAKLQSSDVLLRSGELVPLSQRRRPAVRESFIAHLQGRR
ncbi:LytR/AlgR family response regulator transcription factor [Arabiibacter massiliensis]|uniref:LytR/AlgR family response regulator transcription factor n=1 Tax=Arabiibacter massiliensis TaxID=1870985 RepID=UPI00117A897E|nr:LytTR family DNA-binding domain-containing protein [Arabiibacter massiliensis]